MSLVPVILTNFTSGELSPRLAGRVDVSKYFNGCQSLENFLVQPHGGVARRSGMRFVGEAVRSGGPSLLVPYEDASGAGWVLEFAQNEAGAGVLRFCSGSGRVLAPGGAIMELATPYLAQHLNGLRWVQDRYSLILAHEAFAPRRLSRRADGGFELTVMTFVDQPETWKDGNWPALCCLHEDRLVFAATPDDPFTLWFSRTGEHLDFRLATREVPLDDWDDFEITDTNGDSLSDGKPGDTILLLAGDSFLKNTAVSGVMSDGTLCYYRYIGSRSVTAGLSASLRMSLAATPSTASEIESVRDAGGALRTDVWEMFAIGDRTGADPGDDPLDDDAVEITLSAPRGGRICFLAPRDKLWIGSTSGEWTVSGSSVNTPVTPGGVKANREGTFGSAQVPPCQAGASLLYVQRSGKKVREMAYRLASDSYTSQDLTLLSAHLGEAGIIQLAAVQEPDPMLYCVRADGVLLAMTYLPEQDVCAFSRITTQGAVEAACAVFNETACRDELWLVVRRSIVENGVERTLRCIETLAPGFSETAADTTGAFFVDAGLSYSGAPVRVLTGLGHLAGRRVQILADGSVLPEQTVAADGSITLGQEAATVHVGLGYSSVLRPMRLEYAGQRGSAQTRTKRITEVGLRLYRTLGGKVGPDLARLEPLLYRTSADSMDGPPALFTGDKSVRFPQGWSPDGVLTLVQDQPLPMTVLLIAPTLALNE
ncbi:phage tail protein [Humidesulfovibrio idahonensis]